MIEFPYGIADFRSIRQQGLVYLDRTAHIREVERLGRTLVFLRPRRFGKSLWLQTLANYYDLRRAEEFDELYGDLAIGSSSGREGGPTPLANRYFVLQWNFSKVDASGGVEQIAESLREHVASQAKTFAARYRQHLPGPVEVEGSPTAVLDGILRVVEDTPYRLYLLIDEYDNFANEVLVDDEEVYRELVHSDGPFKYLFKWVKGLLAGAGLERLFITGVSPLVMSDVTSGMNVADNVYLTSRLNTLCGFTDQEVHDLLVELHSEKTIGGVAPSWSVTEARAMVRDWYNGYRFTPIAGIGDVEAVYNPTLVFFFLNHLQREGAYPRQMLDANLAADEGKLDYLAQVATGRDAVIDLIRKDEPLEVKEVRDHFTLRDMLERSAQDESFLGAYLYYFGMLTLAGETPRLTWLLETPNEVVRGLYIERIGRLLLPLGTDRTAAMKPSWDVMEGKAVEPFLDFIERTLFPTFSNRDARWANELTVKTLFLTLLWNPASYITFSEPELEHRYADLCLLRRPDARASSLWDLLFEFKRLSLKEVERSGKDVKATPRAELMELAAVKRAFEEAEEQLVAYRGVLQKHEGDVLKLRAYAVVALGFERLVVRRLP